MTQLEARQALVEAARALLALGLVGPTGGSLSVREDRAGILVTPGGVPASDLVPDMVVPVDLASGQWTGPLAPAGELALHREAHRQRDAGAVVHTHQVAASICAAARVPVPPPYGDLPCAPYGRPGTRGLAEATLAALGDRPAVLMANHGVLCVGADLPAALSVVEQVERTCARYVVDHRPREGSHPPADPSSPWEPGHLQRVSLPDGSEAWLSRAPYTVRFSLLRRPLPAVLVDLARFAGRQVPVARRPPRRARRAAVLVPGRGALIGAPNHEEVAMAVESAARAWIGGQGFGGARVLGAWEVRSLRAARDRPAGQASDPGGA